MAGEIQLNSTTVATESSGAITLSNVNSATNRTNLGLGSIATQAADSISISGGNITGGTLGSSVVFPAGHIVQTTQNTYNSGDSSTTTSSTPATVQDGNNNYYWSHTISNMTPGNDVLVNMFFWAEWQRNDADAGAAFHIIRDNDYILTSANDYQFYSHAGGRTGGTAIVGIALINLTMLDTGATAASHNYFLASSAYNSSSVKVLSGANSNPFRCILQEIQA